MLDFKPSGPLYSHKCDEWIYGRWVHLKQIKIPISSGQCASETKTQVLQRCCLQSSFDSVSYCCRCCYFFFMLTMPTFVHRKWGCPVQRAWVSTSRKIDLPLRKSLLKWCSRIGECEVKESINRSSLYGLDVGCTFINTTHMYVVIYVAC